MMTPQPRYSKRVARAASLLTLLFCIVSSPSFAQDQNVLLIIADDLGVDYLDRYGKGGDPAPTPNIDDLANDGVTFRNAWSSPVCSPTRAALLTGRFGFKNGVTTVVGSTESQKGISLDEYSIARAIEDGGAGAIAHSVVGKWHLNDETNGDTENPNLMGFEYYSGLLTGGFDYFNWEKTENGATSSVSNYSTSEFVDDSIAWIDQQNGPWFHWLAFIAPHSPFHLPPNDLHSSDDLPNDSRSARQNPQPYYKAMIEAMDTEIGRLISYLKASGEYDNTTIMFLGDNGTPGQVVVPPADPERAKSTLYEGGINVPLIVSGAKVENKNTFSDALVNTLDIYATSLDLLRTEKAAVMNADLDAVSFYPVLRGDTSTVRSWTYSELSGFERDPSLNGKAIRNSSHKLIRFESGIEELYHLSIDSSENNNLLSTNLSARDASAYESLSAQLASLLEGEPLPSPTPSPLPSAEPTATPAPSASPEPTRRPRRFRRSR